jgi:hypothetical protein
MDEIEVYLSGDSEKAAYESINNAYLHTVFWAIFQNISDYSAT